MLAYVGADMFDPDPYYLVVVVLLRFAAGVLLGVVTPILLTWLLYFLLTLPMRRTERARWFLDLLELGLKNGRSPEAAIVEAAATRDRSLGVRFHLLAACIEQGMRLTQALAEVPRLLPRQVQAMLAAGERIGDVTRVLPACRLLLKDSLSQVRGALNYLILVGFLVAPFMILVPIVIRVKVVPKFYEIFEGLGEGIPLPAFTRWVFATHGLLTLLQVGLFALLALAVLAYIGGPRLRGWLADILPGATDGLAWGLPWRRKRLQRDFSALLAILLDAGVPEAEAVRLAGEATANSLVRCRAEKVTRSLAQGVALPEALRALDRSGELRWRLANALRGRSGFLRALTGWHQALDAKAFQLEQAAAQLATTGFVLYNGLVVACIFIGMFLALIGLLNHASLW
jgi:type II secretory pathway component PulF